MKCFLILLAALCFLDSAFAERVVNCYFGTWAGYRMGDGKFEPGNIDPSLCTHLSYTFFGINTDGEIKTLDEWNDLDNGKGGISKTIALKKQNPNLKVLAVVGGWNEFSAKYSSMAGNTKKRARFISSSIEFIQKHGFDGLDLDWEYPAQRDGSPKDRVNFVTLLKELKVAFKPYNLILGIAVAASEQSARISYDIPNMSKHLDFINVMTYDFAGVWSGELGFNAPLRGSGANNIEASIKYWLEQGAPPEKLILGIAFYGRSFTTSSLKMSPGSPIANAGAPGKYTRESGYLGYNEICEDINSWTVKWDNEALVPYAFKGNQWVGYDDVKSIGLKMDFVKSMNLGGAMVWSIETDDFRGKCGDRYPLLKAINNALGAQNSHEDDSSTDGSKVVQTTSPPSITTPTPKFDNDSGSNDSDYSDESDDSNGGDCHQDGYFAQHSDCRKFYMCHDRTRYDFQCPDDLLFDQTINSCNWHSLVNCNNFHSIKIRSTKHQTDPELSIRKSSLKVNIDNTGNCITDGFFPNRNDCGSFIVCSNGTKYDFDCPTGLQFDESINFCTWPTFINCTANQASTEPSSSDEPTEIIPPATDNGSKTTINEPYATIPPETNTDDNSELQTTEESRTTDEPSATILPETGTDGNSELQTTEEPRATERPTATTGNGGNGELQSTAQPSTTNEPPKTFPPNNDCEIDGYFVNRHNCGLFFVCSHGIRYDFECPGGLYFDESISTCNWPYLVNCNVVQTTAKPSSTDEPSATLSPETGNGGNSQAETTKEPSVTIEPPNGNKDCEIDGYFVNRHNCGLFFVCSHGIRYDFECPGGLYFDESISTCNWPYLVNCNVVQTTAKPSSTDEPSATLSPETGNGGNSQAETTKEPSVTIEPPNGNKDCEIDGYFVNRHNCGLFFVCSHGIRYDFECPGGLYFDESISTCNWPYLVNCNVVQTTAKPSSTDEPSATLSPETGNGGNSQAETTKEPSVTIEPPNGNKDCEIDGYFVNRHNCGLFFVCSHGIRYDFECPGGLYFDESISTCNWPYLVSCRIV